MSNFLKGLALFTLTTLGLLLLAWDRTIAHKYIVLVVLEKLIVNQLIKRFALKFKVFLMLKTYSYLIIGLIVFSLILKDLNDISSLVSLCGLVCLIFICFFISNNPKKVPILLPQILNKNRINSNNER